MISEKLMYSITDNNSDISFYNGISYYKNFVYATNGALFAKIKYDIPKEYKGKTILKDNTMLDMDKRAYAMITSKAEEYVKNKERDTVDITKISDYIIMLSKINNYLSQPISYIRLGDNLYRVNNLKLLACIAYELFLFNGGISFVNNIHALVIKDSDNLLMCACTDRDINDTPYMDYKTGKLKNFDYSCNLKKIKTDMSVYNKAKKEAKTNKQLKNINEEIAKLSDIKTIIFKTIK